MNKIFLVPPMFLVLTLIPTAAFAHRLDFIINSYSGYQQTCFNNHCAQGYTNMIIVIVVTAMITVHNMF